MNALTTLEIRLEERASERKPPRDYAERWSQCRHAFRRLGELGAARLDECEDCGLVVGVASD